jgi:hypothetical protein
MKVAPIKVTSAMVVSLLASAAICPFLLNGAKVQAAKVAASTQPKEGNGPTGSGLSIVTQKVGPQQPIPAAQPNPLYQRAQATMWAARPLAPVRLPKVAQAEWVQTPLDRFVLARMEKEGVTPTSAASRATLIRRLSFDLLGLPPSYEEVQAFVQEKNSHAVERLVDRLLASPHYGERWGRHWLDVARYADNKGYLPGGKVRLYPYSYTYRDYVIRAFNEDLPFDRFILEQIAADQLTPSGAPGSLAALGFLTVGRRFLSHQDTLDDRIDVVTRGLLGLTVGCARCHDHKYDPIRSADYYALHGIFASCSEPAELPRLDNEKGPGEARFNEELQHRIERREQFLSQRRDQIVAEIRSHARGYFYYAARALLDKTNPPLSSPGGPLRKVAAARWKKRLTEIPPQHDPILAPWYQCAQGGEGDFSERVVALASTWNEASGKDGARAEAAQEAEAGQAEAGQTEAVQIEPINPAVRQAIVARLQSGLPIASILDLADVYGKLFEKVYAQSKQAESSDQPRLSRSAGEEQILAWVTGADSPNTLTVAQAQASYLPVDRAAFQPFRDAVVQWSIESPDAPPRAMALVDHAKPAQSYVFLRGNPANRGPRVARALPALLIAGPEQPIVQGSGRLELARAIASPDNPFTARVFVNRIWAWHFGKPLVSTPSDFGSRSALPTHPELLDFLAREFIDGGWSVKRLHKLILLSATYQQASASADASRWHANRQRDPDNRLWWRTERRRLEWEPLRDSILVVSGKLEPKVGGRPFRLDQQPQSSRRTVYAFIDRQNTPAVLLTFDFANPNATCSQRHETMVPQQGLFLLNSPFVLEQSRALAERALAATGEDSVRRVEALYRLAFARNPSEEELELTLPYIAGDSAAQALAAEQDESKEASLTSWELLAQALLASNEFMTVD